ncbi:hypothetical protein CANINC_004242 [Pichia inconspicua]|uniref:Uncharacterized protein n=1 Tax=Pichia inconspicua TaxID=52247 RepID=A0A4T0WXT4_9ASCO|nr:hypothetical protein CANINC_004242 [[Candida] inconspicua]
MFSPNYGVGSDDVFYEERDDFYANKKDEKSIIFFKDTEDGNQELRSAKKSNNYFKGNPFVNQECSGKTTQNFSIHSNQHNEATPGYIMGNTNDSTTFVDSSEFGNKKEIHTSIKVNNSANSVSSQRLAIARRQNIMKSYFKSFKILIILTFLMFLCPLLSVFLGITCISTDLMCYPRFQVQTSGIVDQNDVSSLSWFKWNTINGNKEIEVTEIQYIEKFIDSLSSIVLTSPFDANLVTLKINEIFRNQKSVIYKFSNFGYCKDITNDLTLVTETICHLTYPYGLDIPSVLVKDLTFMLSEEEIDGDAEYVSDVFSKSCREVFSFMNFNVFGNINLKFYSFMSSVMSRKIAYLSIFEYFLDVVSLFLLIIVSIGFKLKANKSLSTFKTLLFDSNFKGKYNEQTYKFVWIQMCLTAVVIILWISTILKLIGVAYVSIYGVKFTSLLREIDTNVIKGVKLFSSGMILDVLNLMFHLIVAVSLTLCVICKPWIVTKLV